MVLPWDRIQQEVQVKSTLCVGSGHAAYYTIENTTTYFIRSNRRKVHAFNIIPVHVCLIYLQMKNRKCEM